MIYNAYINCRQNTQVLQLSAFMLWSVNFKMEIPLRMWCLPPGLFWVETCWRHQWIQSLHRLDKKRHDLKSHWPTIHKYGTLGASNTDQATLCWCGHIIYGTHCKLTLISFLTPPPEKTEALNTLFEHIYIFVLKRWPPPLWGGLIGDSYGALEWMYIKYIFYH